MVTAASLFPGLLWKPLDPHPYDVMSYHLQIPREWFDAGLIIPLRHNIFSFFPMGVEMHSLLAMHLLGGPWAAMYLCQFFSVAFGTFAALAVVGGVRELGGGGAAAWLAGLATICTPWTLMLSSVCYVESAVMLYSTLAVVWAVIGLRRVGDWRPMLVAGACLGFVCGTKYTAVAMTAAPILILWPIAAWQSSGRRLLKPWLTACLAAAVLFSPWLIRNITWTKNPFFPLATSVFSHAFLSADLIARFNIAHSPPAAESGLVARLSAGWHRVVLDPQFAYVLCAGLFLALMIAIVRRKHFFLVAVLIAGLSIWLLATHDEPRFLSPLIPAGCLAIALIVNGCRTTYVISATIFIVQALAGLTWTWQTLEPSIGIGQKGYFRLPSPAVFDSPELQAAKAQGAKVALIGDAQAFYQDMPSSHLLYRNVFDVSFPAKRGTRSGNETSTADGWLGKPVEQLRREGYWVIVNSDELVRLSRTYAFIPTPTPPFNEAAIAPIVLPPTGGTGQ